MLTIRLDLGASRGTSNRSAVALYRQALLALTADREGSAPDKIDDNDNRLFAVFAEIAWVPKPTFQLKEKYTDPRGQELILLT